MLYTHVIHVHVTHDANLFEEHFSVTIFRSTINNACGSAVRAIRVRCVSMKTYLCYIKALSQLALILLQHWVSIVRAARCNYAPTGNAKRESLRSKRLIKMLFRPKITANNLLNYVGGIRT